MEDRRIGAFQVDELLELDRRTIAAALAWHDKRSGCMQAHVPDFDLRELVGHFELFRI